MYVCMYVCICICICICIYWGLSRLRGYTVCVSGIYRHLLQKGNSPLHPYRDRIGDLGNSLFASNPTKLENGFVLTTCGSRCRARKLRHTTVHTYHETLASLKYLEASLFGGPGLVSAHNAGGMIIHDGGALYRNLL